MAEIPESFIEEVLARSDIVDVVGRRVPLKKKGKEFAACCPFHQEKTPSFYVSPDKQFYHCFGCGAHGTAIRFLMDYDRLDFRDAVEQLAHNAGLALPDAAVMQEEVDERAPLRTAMDTATRFFRERLRHSPEAVDYLKSRDVTGQTAATFALGFAPAGNQLLQQPELANLQDALVEVGLVVQKDDGERYDRFRRRIMFPIRDRRGRVMGFGGRLLGPGEPKYLNSPESRLFHKGQGVYGLFEARQADARPTRLIVVEGYMDVVMLAQHGVRNAVATMGTATTGEQIELLYRQTPTVVFCFDGDNAGRRAALKALQTSLPHLHDGRDLRFLFLPEGEDPDSFIRSQGAEAFRRLVEAEALSFDRFLLNHLEQRFPGDDPAQKTRRLEAGRALIGTLPDGALKSLSLKQLKEQVGLWRRYDQRRSPAQPAQPPRSKPVRREADLLILAIMLQYPRLSAIGCDPGNWHAGAVPAEIQALGACATEPDRTARAAVIAEPTRREQALSLQVPGMENEAGAQNLLRDTLSTRRTRDETAARKRSAREQLFAHHRQPSPPTAE